MKTDIMKTTIMKKNKIYLILVTVIFFSTNTLSAQDTYIFNNSKHRLGFNKGFGFQKRLIPVANVAGEVTFTEVGLNVEYKYEVSYLQAQYYYGFLRKKSWGLDLLVQPQYNQTKYRILTTDSEEIKGYEFGVNLGLLIRKNIFKDFLSFYMCVSVGPHYISGAPQRQSKGFIFSDNLFVGSNIKIYKEAYLDIRYGFRHISNASITEKNGGINDLFTSIGLLVNL